MIKIGLVLGMSAVIASAWFPTMSFGYTDKNDNINIDKEFVRDAQKEIVTDMKTGKIYSDVKPSPKMHFFAAWDYCQNMELAGSKNWRVITKEEAVSLLELSRRNVTVKHAFRNVKDESYWTSTQDRYEEAWYVDFDLGRYSTKKYTNNYRTICVEDTK